MTQSDLAAELAAVRSACPLQMRAVGGHIWSWLQAGGGPAVLLLPGALGTAETSFQYILALQSRYRVLSLDYPATLSSVEPLVRGLRDLLDALALRPVHVIGGSYSGLVAQYLAAAEPQSTASLLLSNIGAPDPKHVLRWRLLAALLSPLPQPLIHATMRSTIRSFLPGESPAHAFWRRYFAAAIAQWSKQAMLNRVRLLADMHARGDRLRQSPFGGPVLIVDAADDRLVPAHQREALHACYPQAQRIILPDKGHAASLDEAAAYLAYYEEFLCRNAAHGA